MCEQRTALDMLNTLPDKGGLSDTALLLHEKQCEDFEKMQKEINEIKNDVSVIKITQENVIKTQEDLKTAQLETNKKIDDMLALVQKKSSFSQNLKDIFNNKVFIYILVTLLTAAFGVSVGEVGIFLFK